METAKKPNLVIFDQTCTEISLKNPLISSGHCAQTRYTTGTLQ